MCLRRTSKQAAVAKMRLPCVRPWEVVRWIDAKPTRAKRGPKGMLLAARVLSGVPDDVSPNRCCGECQAF